MVVGCWTSAVETEALVSYSISDVASSIAAIDNDEYAIGYARRYYACPVVKFYKMDIVREPFPVGNYDVAVWNAAICYFSIDESRLILGKIVTAGSPDLVLVEMLPRANGWIDHKTEFANCQSVERLLGEYFGVVEIRECEGGGVVDFYFQATACHKTKEEYE